MNSDTPTHNKMNIKKIIYPKDFLVHTGMQRETWWRLTVITGMVVLFITILITIDNMLSSFIFAFVISYLSEPLISYFERKGIKRTLSISLYFTFAGLILTILIIKLAPLITQQTALLQSEIPRYVESIRQFLVILESRLSSPLSSVYDFQFSSSIGDIFQKWIELFIGSVPVIAQNTITILILAPFLAFFLLKDGQMIRKKFLTLVPNLFFEMALNLTHNLNLHIGGFIRARLVEAMIVGLVVFLGLTIFQFPYTAFLAVFAAITNLIPYIGPIIGMVPAYMIALAGENLEITILLVTFVYLIAQLIDVFFIIPLVVARIVDLHPITVVVVIIIGSQVMGVLGMIISIPVTKCVKLTISTIYTHLVEFKSEYG